MQLDYITATGKFVLWVPRVEADPRDLMRDYGLDFSAPKSTPDTACLYTDQPYAAVPFFAVATPAAQRRLAGLQQRVDASWASLPGAHWDVPPDQEIWPFQGGSIRYALDTAHTLVGDEPGLGKTPIAVTIANEMRAKRVLVVCPASIRFQWARRINTWSTMRRYLGHRPDIFVATSSRYGIRDNANWTIVSWSLVASPGLWAALAKGRFDLLVLDEAHYAKTIDAKRTQAIFGGSRNAAALPLADRAERVVALTGTPLPNRPREAYVLARHLCWEAIDFLSEDGFKSRFNPSQTRSKEIRRPNGLTRTSVFEMDEEVGRTGELQARLRANFMVRHLKRDVMQELKLPAYDLIRVEETRAIKAALAAENLLDIDPDHLEGADADILGEIATARRLMGVAMAPQVAEYLEMLARGGERKLVVFAWHKEVLDMLCNHLRGFGVLRVDGSDSARSKDAKVQRFIRDPGMTFILGNVMSLGTGTDGLQEVATHCLLAEPDWVHGNNQQCVDRLDRGGQKGHVQADIFVAPGSIAERVLASALRKGMDSYKALDHRVEEW